MVAPSPGSVSAGVHPGSSVPHAGPVTGSPVTGSPVTGSPAHVGDGGAASAALEPAGERAAAEPAAVRAVLSDLLQLTKPRIVMMILITTVIAAVIAAGPAVSPLLLLQLMLGVALVAGSAGAMNQVWEHHVDAQMQRTCRRPIPAGRLGLPLATVFSLVIGVLGSGYLAVVCGVIPALVAIATWVLYVPIYTPLKVRSEWNTTVGAVSGALPVLIGYTAAGGGLGDAHGWLLVGVLVAWQYPHFMAIAWLFRHQYAAAGFQMTTTIEPTGRRAGWQSVVGMLALMGCLLVLAVQLAPGSPLGMVVLASAVLLATYPMTAAAFRFARQRDDLNARRLLRASVLQLPASLALLTCAALYYGV